jgi:isocitrate dehydrogenase
VSSSPVITRIVPFIEGDGTGPDIWRASVRVLDAAAKKAYGGRRTLVWMESYAGEKSAKLLELTLDIGGEQRTVASGIAPTYTPEEMVGKIVIYLANLAPRKIRGGLSQGMILAAGDAQVRALSGLDRAAPPGTQVR